jgi:hypothetical protein
MPMTTGHFDDNNSKAATATIVAIELLNEDSNSMLPRRRIVGAGDGVGVSPPSPSPRPMPMQRRRRGDDHNDDEDDHHGHHHHHHHHSVNDNKGGVSGVVISLCRSIQSSLPWGTIAIILWFFLLGPTMHYLSHSTVPSISSLLRCSSILPSSSSSSSSSSHESQSQSNIILVASHLRHGSDGQLRLRIIEHNLRLLSSSSRNTQSQSQLESILIFSLDENFTNEIHTMVNEWRHHIQQTIPAVASTITNIIYVPNDAILVDASKWMTALYDLLPKIRSSSSNARVMLMNDSFLLTRNTPELWDNNECGEVCGLAWTAPISDPTRHIQSYIRTLSSCAVERYMNFYERSKDSVHNVNELIVLFEINLDWARRRRRRRRRRWRGGGGGGLKMQQSSIGGKGSNSGRDREEDVSAIYEYAGAHPDTDMAQKILLPLGYPAIKLKKFFITDDPWLSMSESSRPELPSSFSASTYKKMNHDLNHLSDSDLEKHFRENGKDEDRIYSSTLPLVIKDWLREELVSMDNNGGMEGGGEGQSTLAILEDYLAALNRDIVSRSSAVAADDEKKIG